MNFNKYHVSKNLFDKSTITTGAFAILTGTRESAQYYCSDFISITATSYYFQNVVGKAIQNAIVVYDANKQGLRYITIAGGGVVSGAVTFEEGDAYIRINCLNTTDVNTVMVNLGSTPLPYEPYSSEVWHDTPHYIHNTSTDTLTTLPADIYANDTTATVGLKGDMSQTGTPSPTTPIQPQECGELETVGAKAGQYKIPILSANITTNVYLGEVPTTRRIKKVVFKGSENWTLVSGTHGFYTQIDDVLDKGTAYIISSHYRAIPDSTDGSIRIANNKREVLLFDNYASADEYKAFLAQQYAAGTPVCVWYVLSTPTTGIVNEPLRKIGTYADEVSGITIPTIAGANTLSVGTTLQPSEVTVNYKGWHPVQSVHERENGAWT